MTGRQERELKVYRHLGVRVFRPFVAGGRFWQRIGWTSKQASWQPSNVHKYLQQIVAAEVAHASSFVFLVVMCGVFIADQDYWEAIALGLLNLLSNVLPLMVIRYNKLRIKQRLARRLLRNLHDKNVYSE
jgi:ABC-type transporter Mla maintaining outer membrane lipid asymmetry permease subunit MlaE